VFEHKRKEILTAAVVQPVLDSIGLLDERCKITVAANFSREASDLLARRGFTVPWKTPTAAKKQATPFPRRVRCSATDQPSGWDISNWEAANNLLGGFDPARRHYSIFDLPDGSYVQCLGTKKALTVEARLYGSGAKFTHWVFGKGTPCGLRTQVGTELGTVTVDRTQVLKMRDARLIIPQFLETRAFPLQYYRQDITERFAEQGNARNERHAPRFLSGMPPGAAHRNLGR
jgi:hypothetical protein